MTISKTKPVRTHIANQLGKCRMCEHWQGVGIFADDNEICEVAEVYCPIWGTRLDSEHLERIYKEE